MALSALEGCGSRRLEDLEDEFACAGVLRGALVALQPAVERVFDVQLLIGGENAPSLQSGQMWLRLRGSPDHVTAAKLFIRGVVNQEVQQEFQFPEVLHCVFCGAKGLFMDCLIKITSAHIVVGSPGCVLISGLTEPVVKAYSFVSDLVEKYRSSQGRVGPVGESMESRRAFKLLVESLEDRHTLDLLVLPVLVKEALLELVKQSGQDTKQKQDGLTPLGADESWRSADEESDRNPRSPQSNGTHDFTQHFSPLTRSLALDTTHFQIPESPERSFPEETEAEAPRDSAGGPEEFEHLLKFFTAMGYTESAVGSVLARTGPREASQLLDLIQREQDRPRSAGAPEQLQTSRGRSSEEDFVLGVMKKAAATCGYAEERVTEAYRPELSPHELLLQLQEDREPDGTPRRRTDTRSLELTADPAGGQGASQPLPALIRGPPETLYTRRPVSPEPALVHSPPRSGRRSPDLPESRRVKPDRASVVTGPQRFLESLKTPFRLELTAEAGDTELRQIIIDGSNVAMSHGLGVFFSCRGIALAVQHFWNRGHRQITVFVPQWRQKNNAKVKERQYLTELHDLGFLSYTPSREVEGRRINSYDDRFMLALAQTTKGVIVTNDNLRDLVDESPAWREIIKKSLLQYVFAGDLFMLPDDPLGRGGPHLRDFLHKHHSCPVSLTPAGLPISSPAPGSHSFAGASASVSPAPTPAPRAHTEVLQYRDWTPGGRGRGQGVRERSVEETLQLRQSLLSIFPDQESVVIMILQCHPTVRDVNRLTELILEQQE